MQESLVQLQRLKYTHFFMYQLNELISSILLCVVLDVAVDVVVVIVVELVTTIPVVVSCVKIIENIYLM